MYKFRAREFSCKVAFVIRAVEGSVTSDFKYLLKEKDVFSKENPEKTSDLGLATPLLLHNGD